MSDIDLSYERVKAFVLLQRFPTFNNEGVIAAQLLFANSSHFNLYRVLASDGMREVYRTIDDLGHKNNLSVTELAILEEAIEISTNMDFHLQANANEPIAFFSGVNQFRIQSEIPVLLEFVQTEFGFSLESAENFLAVLMMQEAVEGVGNDFDGYIRKVEDELERVLLNECFLASTPITMHDGTTKPIEDIRVGDKVLSYDPNGPIDAPLTAKTVTELFSNEVTHILDVHGLMVTPGHVTLCGDGPHKGRHVPMIDILCSDGALVQADGSLIRVATNARVGSTEDAFVKLAYALTSKDAKNGQLQAGEIRVGTLLFDHEGVPVSVLDCIRAEGLDFDPDTGLVQRGDSPAAPLNFFGHPPKPEDYILKRSEAKLADILADGEGQGAAPSVAHLTSSEIH